MSQAGWKDYQKLRGLSCKTMIRYKKIGIKEVLEEYQNVMDDELHYRTVVSNLDGYNLKFSSHRIWTFYEMGIECANCGISGDFFAVEKNHGGEERPHLNLYAQTSDGEILLSKDHIVPKSEGGDDHISNYQTLRKACNEEKGDSY